MTTQVHVLIGQDGRERFFIEMPKETIKTLYALSMYVAGSPSTTRRGLTEALQTAIARSGLSIAFPDYRRFIANGDCMRGYSPGITFLPEEGMDRVVESA
jgi:hypothetical protein